MSNESNGSNGGLDAVVAQMAAIMAKLNAAEQRAEAAEKKAAEAANQATRGKARSGERSSWRYKGMRLKHFVGRGGKPSEKPFVLVGEFRREYADGTPVINPVNGQESWCNSGNGLYAEWIAAIAAMPPEEMAVFADPEQVALIESDRDMQAAAKAESAERNAKRAAKGSGQQTGIGETDILRAMGFLAKGRRK